MNTQEIWHQTLRQHTQHGHIAITTEWLAGVQIGSIPPTGHSLGCNLCRLARKALIRWAENRAKRSRHILNDAANSGCIYIQYINRRQLQSISSLLCGHYCIYFCALRRNRITMHEIVTSLSTDTAFNNAIIHAFACRRLAAAQWHYFTVCMHAYYPYHSSKIKCRKQRICCYWNRFEIENHR